MAKRYTHSTMIDVERAVGCLGQRVTQTLVRGDALAALVHGRRNAIKPDERVIPVDQHGFVPDISRCDIAEDFNNNNRAQQIEHRCAANEIVKTFYLSASLLLGSVAVPLSGSLPRVGQSRSSGVAESGGGCAWTNRGANAVPAAMPSSCKISAVWFAHSAAAHSCYGERAK